MIATDDVWLAFESPDDDEAAYEANTYMHGSGFRVEWSHTAVGQVSHLDFDTLADAYDWLERSGFQNYTS